MRMKQKVDWAESKKVIWRATWLQVTRIFILLLTRNLWSVGFVPVLTINIRYQVIEGERLTYHVGRENILLND